jgi:hypothetical protein
MGTALDRVVALAQGDRPDFQDVSFPVWPDTSQQAELMQESDSSFAFSDRAEQELRSLPSMFADRINQHLDDASTALGDGDLQAAATCLEQAVYVAHTNNRRHLARELASYLTGVTNHANDTPTPEVARRMMAGGKVITNQNDNPTTDAATARMTALEKVMLAHGLGDRLFNDSAELARFRYARHHPEPAGVTKAYTRVERGREEQVHGHLDDLREHMALSGPEGHSVGYSYGSAVHLTSHHEALHAAGDIGHSHEAAELRMHMMSKHGITPGAAATLESMQHADHRMHGAGDLARASAPLDKVLALADMSRPYERIEHGREEHVSGHFVRMGAVRAGDLRPGDHVQLPDNRVYRVNGMRPFGMMNVNRDHALPAKTTVSTLRQIPVHEIDATHVASGQNMKIRAQAEEVLQKVAPKSGFRKLLPDADEDRSAPEGNVSTVGAPEVREAIHNAVHKARYEV